LLRKLFLTLSSAACFFIAFDLHARSTVDVGLSLAGFSYAEILEPGLRSTHRGLLTAARAGFDHRFSESSWSVGVGFEYGISAAGFDGTTQDGQAATANSRHSFFNAELLADTTLDSGRNPVHLYFGAGTHYWMRHIGPDNPTDHLRERYLWFYLPLGIRYTYWESGNWFARLDLSVRVNIGGNIYVYNSEIDAQTRDTSLSLGFAVGGRAQFPFRYFMSRSVALQFVPFFEFRPIGEGAPEPIVSVTGETQGTALEPASRTFLYGVFVGPAFLL